MAKVKYWERLEKIIDSREGMDGMDSEFCCELTEFATDLKELEDEHAELQEDFEKAEAEILRLIPGE
jgi:predicted nuclease with TOPRIM domain